MQVLAGPRGEHLVGDRRERVESSSGRRLRSHGGPYERRDSASTARRISDDGMDPRRPLIFTTLCALDFFAEAFSRCFFAVAVIGSSS